MARLTIPLGFCRALHTVKCVYLCTMNRDFALDLLQLRAVPDDAEVFEELFQEAVFEVREYFLRFPIVAALYRSRIHKLRQFDEAAQVLGFPQPKDEISILQFSLGNAKALDALFAQHQQALSMLRLQLASTFNCHALATLTEAIVNLQDEYESQLLELTPEIPESDAQIKAADITDSGQLAFAQKSDPPRFHSLLMKEKRRIQLIRERTRRL